MWGLGGALKCGTRFAERKNVNEPRIKDGFRFLICKN